MGLSLTPTTSSHIGSHKSQYFERAPTNNRKGWSSNLWTSLHEMGLQPMDLTSRIELHYHIHFSFFKWALWPINFYYNDQAGGPRSLTTHILTLYAGWAYGFIFFVTDLQGKRMNNKIEVEFQIIKHTCITQRLLI